MTPPSFRQHTLSLACQALGLLMLCSAFSLAQAQSSPAVRPAAVSQQATAGAASRTATQATFVREFGGISEYRLPNGLQILLLPDAAQSTTTVNITYRVGSRHESQGEYGMAHLLEHMLFKGTPTHKDIPTAFAQRGMRFNGTTSEDRTNYFASFNANPDTLAFAIALEADRMRHSFIAKADLDKEMTVVRNEFERGENEPLGVLQKRVQAAAYSWHAYGHSTIGARSDIENVPIERLQAFYHLYYRPDNATVLVAGRFDPATTLALISQSFGPLPQAALPVPQPYTEEPAQDGERSVVVRRVGGSPSLLLGYHIPALAHPDSAALQVYSLLLSLQPSGRLYKSLVETKLATQVYTDADSGQAPSLASALVVLPPDADVDKVERLLVDQIEGRAGEPFTEAEIQRVRDLALMDYRQQMKNPEALIQRISSNLGAGDWRLNFQVIDDLGKVTLADVERVRRSYFKPANRTTGRYLPAQTVERVEIPATPALGARLAQLKPPPKVEEGENLVPTPDTLKARTVRQQLASGIVLQTLRKQTRGNTVTLQAQFHWGDAPTTTTLRGTTALGALLLEGSQTWSKQALQDELVRLKADLHISSGKQGATVTIRAEKDTLLAVLKIASELLQHPLLPQDAFERIRAQQIAALEGSRQELGTLRTEVTRTHYNQARRVKLGEPDYIPGLDESIQEWRDTTLDEVRQVYQTYWSAKELNVAVVGALPEGLEAALDASLGHWKKPQAPRFVRHVTPSVAVAPARFDVQADDKANAIVQWRQNLVLNRRDADYPALQLAAYIFGGGSLESRLATRVRRDEGLSYGIGAILQVPDPGQDAALAIVGSYAPQNRDRVIAAVQDELQRMARDGVNDTELTRAKTAILEARLQGRANEGQLASTLNGFSELGQDWGVEAGLEAALREATLAQVNAAWRQFIKPEAFVLSTAGDFKKTAQAQVLSTRPK
jgi:zinc protease